MYRETELKQWLTKILKTESIKLNLLAGDASFRRYYRVAHENKSYVVMDAPPPESPKLFIEMACLLENQGLTVPKIYEQDLHQGFLLLSDFGDKLYLNELNDHSVFSLYEDAFHALLKMQRCKANLAIFDKAFATQELNILFKEWYLQKHLHLEETFDFRSLDTVLEVIISVVESQPKVFIHRDYHSRNLMWIESIASIESPESKEFSQQNPGILDFQDAMLGPVTYDLVSLLQDCYIAWPRPMVEEWVREFQRKLMHSKLLPAHISFDTFLRWFDFTGVQRHLKNLGIFSRKFRRDQNPNYLKDIPMPLKYIEEAFERYPELKPLSAFFKQMHIKDRSLQSV